MTPSTDPSQLSIDQQVALLMQGTSYGDDETKRQMTADLRERLIEAQRAGRPLRVYCGYDPTKPDLHLGHTITMRKLRQFQDLGHEVTFLIGTFTGMLGDASDKDKVRKQQTLDESLAKAETYAEQVFRILDRERTVVKYNHEWLGKLSFGDVIGLASHFTVQQFLARDSFAKRYAKGDSIWVHEFMYAFMQGYDCLLYTSDAADE